MCKGRDTPGAVPPSTVKRDERFLGCLLAVVAPIDMKARRDQMDEAGCKLQALGSGCHREAVEFDHPLGIEGIQGPA